MNVERLADNHQGHGPTRQIPTHRSEKEQTAYQTEYLTRTIRTLPRYAYKEEVYGFRGTMKAPILTPKRERQHLFEGRGREDAVNHSESVRLDYHSPEDAEGVSCSKPVNSSSAFPHTFIGSATVHCVGISRISL